MNSVMHYPWLMPTWQAMQQAFIQNRVPGAVLVQSAADLAVDTLVMNFAKTLLCCNQHHGEACGLCHSCELFASHSHPDFHQIKPEKSGKSIGVDQIRSCNRIAQESSQLGGYRVFVIDPAEAMNVSSSNALLKTLEEPGEKCCFVLVTEQKQQLLPTIVSRCQQWHVTVPTIEQSQHWLAAQGLNHVELALLKLAQQSPIRAQIMFDQKEWTQYQNLEQATIEAFTSEYGDYQPLVDVVLKATQARLAWLWFLLTDTQKYQHGIRATDMMPGCAALSHLSVEGIYQSCVSLIELKKQLNEFPGLNEELLVSNWVIESREGLCL